MRIFLIFAATVLLTVAWALVVFIGASEGWGRQALTASAQPGEFMQEAVSVIEEEARGNVAFVLIEDGKVADSYYRSAGEPVGPDTLFQVASLSKWVSAWGVMALAQDGLIDLDAPVSTYLSRWELPASEFDNDGVTVRRLLSHTAGLNDGLGYAGFGPDEEVQSLEDSLTQARDASPDASGVVRIGSQPGEAWNYSGGGYTLMQLIVEEVSGRSFDAFMKERVFQPLGMDNTTYVLDEAARAVLAQNFDTQGEAQAFRRYTSLAATSLFTTAEDMTLFLQAHMPDTGPDGTTVLSLDWQEEMHVPHASQWGADIWGLGVMLYAPNGQGSFVIGHDGNDEPAINTAARFDPATADGIVFLETGNELLATRIAGEWVFWKTGNVDFLLFALGLETTLIVIGVGTLVILILGGVAGWRFRRRRM